MKNPIKKLLLGGTALVSVGFGSAAHAQSGAGGGLEDIVVTAQKRAENVQDTPVSITAVTQATLVRQGVKDITDLTRVAPEITVLQQGPAAVPSIRGLRTGVFAPGTDSPNAVHVDGNYLARYQGQNGFFYDLERVEVLAGPQGTLFGRNSVGGTVNIITHKPDLDKFGGSISADIGNYNSLVLQGAINVPLADKLALRVAGYRNRRDGYYTDTNTLDSDLEGYRVSFKWQPTEKDTILLAGDWEHFGGNGVGTPQTPAAPIVKVYKNPTIFTVVTPAAVNPQAFAGSVGTSCPAGATCTSAVIPINVTDDPWHNRNVTGGDYARNNQSMDGYNFQWDHDLDFATLTAQGSWRTHDTTNPSGTFAGAAQDPRLRAALVVPLAIANATPGISRLDADSQWNSQEIRLTSNDASQKTFQYVLGVNHFHDKNYVLGSSAPYASWWANNSVAAPGTTIGALVYPVGANGLPIFNGGNTTLNNIWTDAYAVFGQVTYTPASWEALHVTLGGRYNWEDRHAINALLIRSNVGQAYTYAPYNGQVVCPAGTIALMCPAVMAQYAFYDETKSWERATYKAGLSYDLTDHNMVYATYSTGYLSGGMNYGPPQHDVISGNDHSYKPLYIEAQEIGIKNRFFDNRVQLNASIYHYDFTNYLTNQNINYPDITVPNTRRVGTFSTANAGDTEFQGGTFDFLWEATDNDRFHLNGQFTEAEVKFDLSDFYFKATKGILQGLASQGVESTDACVLAAMIGPVCPGYSTFIGGNFPLYTGSTFPDDFNRGSSFERPKWTLNADFTHTFKLPDATLDAQVAWHYTGKQALTNGLFNIPANPNPVVPAGFTNLLDINNRIPEKDTWDLSFSYQKEDANWSVTAYVRNVTDDTNLAQNGRTLSTNVTGLASINLDTLQTADAKGVISGTTANYAYLTETYDPPRTFGVQFQANF